MSKEHTLCGTYSLSSFHVECSSMAWIADTGDFVFTRTHTYPNMCTYGERGACYLSLHNLSNWLDFFHLDVLHKTVIEEREGTTKMTHFFPNLSEF